MKDLLLESPFGKQWSKTGTDKRAGVVFPLFSLYSKKSTGIGEFPDLKLAIDWCKVTGNSILQLLPLNDTGFQSSPFSAQTSIGLNPLYISLSELKGAKETKEEEQRLKTLFPIQSIAVDYKIGKEKINALRSIFDKGIESTKEFRDFIEKNNEWLNDLSLFRSLKNHYKERSWKEWEKRHRERDRSSIDEFTKNNKEEIIFWKWIQWQAFEQLKEVKEYATKNDILMKGDIPLFVSDDSVDCWTDRKYFKMDSLSGTPPDEFSKEGQIWGMPPYNWEAMMNDDFEFFRRRNHYAENFYHLFRIDHVVGLFRTWFFKESSTKIGSFDLNDPIKQKERGEKILKSMMKGVMLPCAEDLGTVPDFCRETLKELGIPGLDVGRWQKRYREIAVSTLSTHDMDLFPAWLEKKKIGSNQENIDKGVNEVLASPSVFSILLIFDWLFFSETMKGKNAFEYRINRPGIKSDNNWSVRLPLSMEELLADTCNKKIFDVIKHHSRLRED